jgi:outer membrane lipoprotein-sorting protein
MNDPMNNHDLVDQAVAELVDAPIEEGPSQSLVGRTLDALSREAAEEKPAVAGRIHRINWTARIAAVFIIGLAGVGVVLMLTHVGGGGSVSASEVARRLREARTMSCNWSMDLPGNGRTTPVTMRMFFKEQGKLRIEAPGAVTTLDTSKNKLLVLNTMIKTAFARDLREFNTGPENPVTEIFDWVEKIKNTTGQQAQSIGTKQIDGKEAWGFMLNEQGMAYTVWADAYNGMPLRIEIPIDLGQIKTTVVMSDLSFDQPVDDSLFAVQPPDGYLLMDFEVLLRRLATKSGGKLP